MASSSNMASSIKLEDKDKERLDTLKAKLSFHGINLNQEQLFSKLLDLGENFLIDLNLEKENTCKNCGTKVAPSKHCRLQMHLEKLNGTLEWVCWMGASCGHKVFEPCCNAPSLPIYDTVNM